MSEYKCICGTEYDGISECLGCGRVAVYDVPVEEAAPKATKAQTKAAQADAKADEAFDAQATIGPIEEGK